ncbi:hypothetical protein [Terrimonas ferruginea]|uniref:hypothetical protein n=1 Tax=Terrimonas ferruginea TaxID=249 RepID=UPI0004069D5C|nr:hypothetical protein [Terrimonas ferruginea]
MSENSAGTGVKTILFVILSLVFICFRVARCVIKEKKSSADTYSLNTQYLAQEDQRLKTIQRNNWHSKISVTTEEFSDSGPNTKKHPAIYVNNRLNADLDEIGIELLYMDKKGKLIKKDLISLYNIKAFSRDTTTVKNYKNTTSLEAEIVLLKSEKLELCFPDGIGSSADPYHCY